MKNIFVTGIGTDVGKTVVSAILAEAFDCDYWKPVQSGSFYGTDSITVRNLVKNPNCFIHPEAILLKHSLSPHAAAEQEGITLDAENIVVPNSARRIVIEGSGGVLVPFSANYLVADMIKKFDCEVVVVIQNYMGSTNHSLLTLEALKNRNIPILGLVFNGAPHRPTEEIITHHSGARILGRVMPEKNINSETVQRYAHQFKAELVA